MLFNSEWGRNLIHLGLGGTFLHPNQMIDRVPRRQLSPPRTAHQHHLKRPRQGKDRKEVEDFLENFHKETIEGKRQMLQQLKEHRALADLSKRERKGLNKIYRRELVKRSALLKIVAAWIITVPVSGLLAAILFYTIRGMMLP